MSALRAETKTRARALQLLYAWEIQGQSDLKAVSHRLAGLAERSVQGTREVEALAKRVSERVEALDREIEETIEGWRLSRIGVVERNILRLALTELLDEEVPAKVVIDEALRLAHWFAGPKAYTLVNGVLDTLARRHGRL